MLMVCVYNHGYEPNLTIGKIYDATVSTNHLSPIKVVDDCGRTFNYDDHRFIRLDEYRANKLKEIGI